MKLFRFLVVPALLALFASVSFAQTPIDPGIGLGGTGSSGSFTQTQCLASDALCTLSLDSTGSGIADITNNTGFNIILDTITVHTLFSGTLTCNSINPFGFKSVVATSNSCTYSFGNGDPLGIGGGAYGVHFTDFSGLTSLQFNLSWTNGSVPTPEPSSILLLGAGLAALVLVRKRRKLATLNA